MSEQEWREKVIAATRELGAHSFWDSPGWTLHVPEKYAKALFDAVYATPSAVALADSVGAPQDAQGAADQNIQGRGASELGEEA